MTEISEPLGFTKVKIELNAGLKAYADSTQSEGQTFATELLKYLNGFLHDLSIPTTIFLSVKVADGLVLNAPGYRIQIDDKNCRIPVYRVAPPQAVDFARSVARIILTNLELVLSADFSEKLLENWITKNAGDGENRVPIDGFQRLLKSLVERGYNIRKGRDVCQMVETTGRVWNTAECFEEATAELDSTTIKILLQQKVKDSISDMLRNECEALQSKIFDELGIALPQVEISETSRLEEKEFCLQLNDVRLPPVVLFGRDEFLVEATPDKLAELKVTSKEDITNPETGVNRFVCEDKKGALKKCKEAGLRVWDRAEFIALNLEEELRRNAGSFLTLEAVRYGLDLMEDISPALVDLAKRFDETTLAQILRCLLDEEISIKNGRSILESLVFIGGTTSVDHSKYLVFYPDPPNLCPAPAGKGLQDLSIAELSNRVRMSLMKYISHKYAAANTLVFYTMAPEIEQRIAEIDQVPFEEEDSARLINAILEKTKSHSIPNSGAVIVTSVLTRKKLRELIEKELPRLAVLCFQELSPNLRVQHLSQISWANV